MMGMRKMWAVCVAAVLLLAACGGGHASRPTVVRVCSGLTDSCSSARVQQLNHLAQLRPFPGCRIVDVSDYQSASINWGYVRRFVCGAIDKAGEGGSYGGGAHFVRNWLAERAAGLWHAAYWFVRPPWVASCATQAQLIIARLKSVGYATDYNAGPVALDEEVPGANLTGCLYAALHTAFHRIVDIYTSPGTWPGGSHYGLPLWQASYGSVLSPFWTPVVAWQCTDGVSGCVSYVPGLGYGDVSANRGITSQVLAKPKHKPPHCLAAKYPHTTQCYRVRYGYSRTEADLSKVQRRLKQHDCQARRHPSYCAGWRWAVGVDRRKLAAFRKTYA